MVTGVTNHSLHNLDEKLTLKCNEEQSNFEPRAKWMSQDKIDRQERKERQQCVRKPETQQSHSRNITANKVRKIQKHS